MVSAIITTHNRKELLRRAIESVLSQTYLEMECIVIDDASNDGTDQICKLYPVRYIYIPKEESKGGNYARNLGIYAAVGEYVAFLDDDDYWLPTKIEKQVKLIEEKDCELVFCGKRLEIVGHECMKFKDSLPETTYEGDMSRKILLTICCTTTTNILAKRQALIDVGLFDESLRFWQEYELTIRMAQRKPFYFVNEVLSVYRIDKKDSSRLTNKYYLWKDAVRYIHSKHKQLYSLLSYSERLEIRLLIWYDAMGRCKNSGLVFHYLFYRMITFPFSLFEKIKNITFA